MYTKRNSFSKEEFYCMLRSVLITKQDVEKGMVIV